MLFRGAGGRLRSAGFRWTGCHDGRLALLGRTDGKSLSVSIVIVLHAPRPGHLAPDRLQALLAALPYAKRLEIERRDRDGRAAGLAGIALALEAASLLRGVPVPAADLRFPQDGKPALAGGPFFSVSHTNGWDACAASVDLDCGLDIEAAQVPAADDAATAARLMRWTATEAVLKAAGLGLRQAAEVEVMPDLQTACLRGTQYYLRTLDLGSRLIAHLATLRPVLELRTERSRTAPGVPAPRGR